MNKKNEKLVVANFKMDLSAGYELRHWITNFQKAKQKMRLKNSELVLCPQFIYLSEFMSKIKSKYVKFGTQNCFWEQKGAFTGEVSPVSIYSQGGRYVILGHSERRKYFGETSQIIALKIQAALKAGLSPIVCIGEDLQEKKMGVIMRVVKKQIDECLREIGRGRVEKVVICYEPVWAISANNPDAPPNANEIMEAKLVIKKILTDCYGRTAAEKVSIIYGGSVDSKNVEEVCIRPGMSGVLIGKASLAPYDLVKITEVIDS